MSDDPQKDVLMEIVMDYALHDSWRCYSEGYYPDECHCGLDGKLKSAGLDPLGWRGMKA